MSARLSLSIVLYKTSRTDIDNCLGSLDRVGTELRIYIIDNSPSNELKSAFGGSNVVYYHNPSNPGFGAAHNVGLRMSADEGFDYHLVLNADIAFSEDVITPMIEYMDAHPDVGQMMPRVKNPDGTLQRLCKLVPTPADLLFRRLVPSTVLTDRQRRFEMRDSGYERTMFVPFLSGCFMLLRNSVIKEVGGFDERFFMYSEDIDLTRRIADRYDTLFFPHVGVTHGYAAASRKSARMFIIHAVNVSRYFNKWGWINDPIRDRLNRRTLAQFTLPTD
jgi:GT2 family glycosyltransferase